MGLITRQLTQGDRFVKSSNECSDCNGAKAVAGMENKDAHLTNRNEKGAGVAVDKTTKEGKRYVLADGPASNLFTKALEVKFNNGDDGAELVHERPTKQVVKSSGERRDEVRINGANESAAQDAYIQNATANREPLIESADTNVSRFTISRTDGNPRDPISVNPVHAFKQLADTGIDVEFVMVAGDTGKSAVYMDGSPNYNDNNQTKNSVGRVSGMVANEGLEITSVQVIVKYR